MIHLDVKTEYSFLKAYGSPQQVIDRAKAIGASAFGIADICSTWGHIPTWKAAKKSSIKALFGVQIPVVRTLEKDPKYDLITLIAENNLGLQKQYEALTLATKQFYYRPRLTWSQIEDCSDNFVLINRLSPSATQIAKRLKGKIFGAVGPSPSPVLNLVRNGELSGALAMSPLFPTPSDREAYQVMCAIGTARKTYDIDAPDAWMMTQAEIDAKFSELSVSEKVWQNWYRETQSIAISCQAEPTQAKNVRPMINRTVEQWCVDGAVHRNIDLSVEPYKSRLQYELELIRQKGFEDYFLLIADLIQWAKEQMFVGPARGSSAGSLVCYLMGIVEVNPIEHKLMFERFIDVTRIDLPDVDIDFPDAKRDLVFEYVKEKYGENRVARLGTTSVFKPKSAMNDVAKCYSVPKWEIKGLTELLIERSGGDARANMTFIDTISQFEKAKELMAKNPKLYIIEKLEGHIRHTGKHAAGLVISDDDITKYCAIDYYKGGIAEITKFDAESIGLMKIDALGLKTLSVIDTCCEQAKIDPKSLYTLPLDDKKVFDLFQQDRVAGIFQFEGYAVRSLMRQMGVEDFNDISALTALARPGPLHSGGANEFIARRTGQKEWDYAHPLLAPHTKETYGTIVYQEQVMSITRDLGNMDWQDVNALRRAMSKSLGEEFFNHYRDKFLKGALDHGIPNDEARVIWDEMCTFGSWAFNLSHAVSYGILSYWCAWLKTYYPIEFAVAHLRHTENADGAMWMLRELNKEGYVIVPFDHELSEISWSAKNGKILGGFTGVKGIGKITAEKLIDKRNSSGEGWINELSASHRAKLLSPNNTPWHNISRLRKKYKDIYLDPENYKSDILPNGIKGKVVHIEDITEKEGEYCFIATLKNRNLRDLNEALDLARRGGRVIKRNNIFLNLQVEDDTGGILCTVDRFRYGKLGKPLMEQEADGHDFLIRGRILRDGWRKINVEKMIRLSRGTDETNSDRPGSLEQVAEGK